MSGKLVRRGTTALAARQKIPHIKEAKKKKELPSVNIIELLVLDRFRNSCDGNQMSYFTKMDLL